MYSTGIPLLSTIRNLLIVFMIETTHLFAPLDRKLIDLLKTLSRDDWNKNMITKLWTVKDVAAHLLDGNLRMLSVARDGHRLPAEKAISSYNDVVSYINPGSSLPKD
jgi:hypothetical protein